jgi:hypothetical protein
MTDLELSHAELRDSQAELWQAQYARCCAKCERYGGQRGKHARIQNRRMGGLKMRKEVYCETCGSDQPLIEHEPQKDDLNPYPWYDLQCGTCYAVIATIQLVPDDKPIEPSAVMTDSPSDS